MAVKSMIPSKKVVEKVYPSQYGSHESMIDENLTSQIVIPTDDTIIDPIVCRDGEGPIYNRTR